MIKRKLTILGKKISRFPRNPGEATLEAIPFNKGECTTTVNLITDEFTSLCPVTGQPDFGEIRIEYVPDKFIIESKSLKLYLFSFRNIGMFQEEIVNRILSDLKKTLSPLSIKVTGTFKSRGGIVISPIAEWKK